MVLGRALNTAPHYTSIGVVASERAIVTNDLITNLLCYKYFDFPYRELYTYTEDGNNIEKVETCRPFDLAFRAQD